MASKTQNGEWEQTCFRCYVVAESLDVDDIGERLADALLDAGFNHGEDDIGAFIAVVPEEFPAEPEGIVKFFDDLNTGLVILPTPAASKEEQDA